MKDQLEALILQMYKSNILYSEAVREFKKCFIATVLEENKGNQCRAARQLGTEDAQRVPRAVRVQRSRCRPGFQPAIRT